MNELFLIAAFSAVAMIIGAGLGFTYADRRARAAAKKSQDIQQRFDDYRQQVTKHFGRTAEHFQAIGEQYRELYEHMASGADTLFDLPSPAPGVTADVPAAIAESSGQDEHAELAAASAADADEVLLQPADAVVPDDDEEDEQFVELVEVEPREADAEAAEEPESVAAADAGDEDSPRILH